MAAIDFHHHTSDDGSTTVHAHVAGYASRVTAPTPQRAVIGALSALVSKAHCERRAAGHHSRHGILPAVATVDPAVFGHPTAVSDPATVRNLERIAAAGIVWHIEGTGPAPQLDTEPVPHNPAWPLPPRNAAHICDVPWAVIDIEATTQRRIVEIAVRRYVAGQLHDTWHSHVNPGQPIAEDNVHHVTDADVADAPTFEQIAGQVCELLYGCVVVGHNVHHDVRMLGGELNRIGVTTPAWPTFDTHRLASQVRYCARARLSDLAEHFGIAADRYHAAAVDAEVTARVLAAQIADRRTPQRYLRCGTPDTEFQPNVARTLIVA